MAADGVGNSAGNRLCRRRADTGNKGLFANPSTPAGGTNQLSTQIKIYLLLNIYTGKIKMRDEASLVRFSDQPTKQRMGSANVELAGLSVDQTTSF